MDVRPDDPQGPGVARPAPGALEAVLALILRSGVATATALLALGTLVSFARHPDYRTSTEVLRSLLDPEVPRVPSALLATLPQIRGQAFVLLGLIFLIATPIVRVAATAALLARRGERRLARFGVAVLLLLLASFALGQVAH